MYMAKFAVFFAQRVKYKYISFIQRLTFDQPLNQIIFIVNAK